MASGGQSPVFLDVEFMTAKEKSSVYRDWTALFKLLASEGLPAEPPKSFSKALYQHLHLHCQHIAHYDRFGFWDAQLGSAHQALQFLQELEQHLRGWGALRDYADLNEAMLLVGVSLRPLIEQRLVVQRRDDARAQIAAIAKQAGLPLPEALGQPAPSISHKFVRTHRSMPMEHAEQASLF